jgi:hypothetical protein
MDAYSEYRSDALQSLQAAQLHPCDIFARLGSVCASVMSTSSFGVAKVSLKFTLANEGEGMPAAQAMGFLNESAGDLGKMMSFAALGGAFFIRTSSGLVEAQITDGVADVRFEGTQVGRIDYTRRAFIDTTDRVVGRFERPDASWAKEVKYTVFFEGGASCTLSLDTSVFGGGEATFPGLKPGLPQDRAILLLGLATMEFVRSARI